MSYQHSITPSFILNTLANYTDEELRKVHIVDILKMLRQLEEDYKLLLMHHRNFVNDSTCNIYTRNTAELARLTEVNKEIYGDNQELRDLCCFLDDDRQRGRKLAREWQRFGRYTASVMKCEVTAYQSKLSVLEQKQNFLLKENNEMKQLCLYLDQELSMGVDRDDGDGSSNSTNISETQFTDGVCVTVENSSHVDTNSNNIILSACSSETHSADSNNGNSTNAQYSVHHSPSAEYLNIVQSQTAEPLTQGRCDASQNCTPAIVNAVKALEVHESVSRAALSEDGDDMSNNEKVLVRQLCNVVWRKLGHAKSNKSSHDNT